MVFFHRSPSRSADTTEGVRLVRGSHIVTKKLFDNDKSYFFQSEDGRVIFAIPCETDFTLVGTTDADHDDPSEKPESTPKEAAYLCRFASNYFMRPIMQDDIVWTYSGFRPLYNGGAKSATAATRDYVLKVVQTGGAPLLNVFGGMITTYRKLAEDALAKIAPFFPGTSGDRTAGVALPGGDFPVSGVQRLIEKLKTDFSFLGDFRARRLIRAYGTDAWTLFGGAKAVEDLGQDFGATLTAREVDWPMDREFARTEEDAIWHRSTLGLRLTGAQIEALDAYMASRQALKGKSKPKRARA